MNKITKKFLLGTLAYGVLGFANPVFSAGSSSKCPCTDPLTCGTPAVDVGQPYFTTDPVRGLVGLVAGIIALTGDGESKAKLIAKQEENNQKATGSGGSATSTDTSSGQLNTNTLGSAADSEFSGSAFDYISTQLLSKEGNVGYAPLKSALASSTDDEALRNNIRTAVLKEFFADPGNEEQSATEYKTKIQQQRNKYIQEASNRHVTLGYRVKGYIQNDLGAIATAAVSGDGELGSIAVDAHTLEQMVKMELVDLALQIEMMEADAVQFLANQPIELMSKTKPTN